MIHGKGRWPLRTRLRAWFDSTMDRGTPALVAWLGLASVVIVLVIAGLVALLDRGDVEGEGFGGVVWLSLMRTIDSGTVAGDTGSPLFLALMLIATVGGIFVVSAFIGVLTAGLEDRITELRKGRSPVIVSGHTVILGWSDQIFTIVAELVAANQENRRTSVVVLADRDKVAMQDELRARVGDTGRLRVTCRTGSPLKRIDLDLASLDTAASVIILSPPGDRADIDVIKTLLLLHNRAWAGAAPHVVAAIQDSHNLAAARLAAGEHPQLVDADDIAVRLVVQSHRQPGLSTVYSEILSFAGSEIYVRPEPGLGNTTFGAALRRYASGCPIGIRHADGTFQLNPSSDAPITPDDQMIILAEDDTLIALSPEPNAVDQDHILAHVEPIAEPDRTLLVGWNSRGVKVLDLLDQIVAPGSMVAIAAPEPPTDLGSLAAARITVSHQPCDPVVRAQLEAIDPSSYQHVVVLADDRLPPDAADDRTLMTLLHLRDIATRSSHPFAIVTEMHDDANREVAQVTKADDFIVSARLITLLVTQLSQNQHLQPILADLFDPAGPEIKLVPAKEYVAEGAPVTFATVVEAARRRGQTAIGYRLHRHRDEAPGYGIVLNPPKDQPCTYAPGDSLVVLTEQ